EGDVEELGLGARRGGEKAGDLDVEAGQRVGVGRVGLHERGAPFGIAGPFERRRLGEEGPAEAGRHVRKRTRREEEDDSASEHWSRFYAEARRWRVSRFWGRACWGAAWWSGCSEPATP